MAVSAFDDSTLLHIGRVSIVALTHGVGHAAQEKRKTVAPTVPLYCVVVRKAAATNPSTVCRHGDARGELPLTIGERSSMDRVEPASTVPRPGAIPLQTGNCCRCSQSVACSFSYRYRDTPWRCLTFHRDSTSPCWGTDSASSHGCALCSQSRDRVETDSDSEPIRLGADRKRKTTSTPLHDSHVSVSKIRPDRVQVVFSATGRKLPQRLCMRLNRLHSAASHSQLHRPALMTMRPGTQVDGLHADGFVLARSAVAAKRKAREIGEPNMTKLSVRDSVWRPTGRTDSHVLGNKLALNGLGQRQHGPASHPPRRYIRSRAQEHEDKRRWLHCALVLEARAQVDAHGAVRGHDARSTMLANARFLAWKIWHCNARMAFSCTASPRLAAVPRCPAP
jgi:hypothetical protein